MRRSASHGPNISKPTSRPAHAYVATTEVLTGIIAIQPICATVTTAAYVRHAERRCGSCLAARNHCATNAIRITT